MNRAHRRDRRGERGLTLVEVLIAFALLFFVSLAVLAMYSAALAVNLGSLAKTDLAYRCERVAETVRLQHVLSLQTPPTNDATCCPMADGTYPIPPQNCTTTFWGPVSPTDPASVGAGVTQVNAPFTISYTLVTNGTLRTVTVTAQPTGTGSRYLGTGLPFKAVTYATHMSNP